MQSMCAGHVSRACVQGMCQVLVVAHQGPAHPFKKKTLPDVMVSMRACMQATEGVIVVAATNFAEVLDKALVRPGRFDRCVYMHRASLYTNVHVC